MFKKGAWFDYLDPSMKDLVEQSYYLLDREEVGGEELPDYSFVVFPMAKAYEGFLKKYFFDLKLINEKAYMSKHFRIGKSLNPSLPVKYRDERWLYDDLEKMCGQLASDSGKGLPRRMWRAWKRGRNKTFHYFAEEKKMVDLAEAREMVDRFREVMELAVECKGEFLKR